MFFSKNQFLAYNFFNPLNIHDSFIRCKPFKKPYSLAIPMFRPWAPLCHVQLPLAALRFRHDFVLLCQRLIELRHQTCQLLLQVLPTGFHGSVMLGCNGV